MTSLFRRHRRGRPPHPDVLTPAEWRVLDEIRAGRSNPEIADRLGISRNTVKTHISSMLAKLALADREALAAWDGEPAIEMRPRTRSALLAPFAWLSGRGVAVTAAVATVAAVAVFIVAMESGRLTADDPRPTPEPTATPTVAEPTSTPAPGGDASTMLQPVDLSRWVRHDIDANRTIPLDHGIAFIDAATGNAELWALAAGEPFRPYTASPGGRFVLNASNLLDRERGAAYTWGGLLVEMPTDTGYALYASTRASCRYAVIDLNGPAPAIAYEFAIASGASSCGDQPHAAIAEDGSALFLAVNVMDASGRTQVFHIEGPGGAVTDLGMLEAPYGTFDGSNAAGVLLTPVGPADPPPALRLYAWDGTLRSTIPVAVAGDRPGAFVLSPDATVLAWQEIPGLRPPDGFGGHYLWPTIMVADAESGEPRFRVLLSALHTGTRTLEWLPDGSALVIATGDGFALLSPTDGTMTPLPFGPAGHFAPIPLPAPDDPARFLYDAAIVDGSGNVLTAPAPAWNGWVERWWSAGSYEWGRTSGEIRITGHEPPGRDYGPGGVGDLGLPPRVEFPPFDNEIRVRLTGDDDDRTLRPRPEDDAPGSAMLPLGTVVTVLNSADSAGCNGAPGCATVYDPGWEENQLFWIHVRAADGAAGWIPARSLEWAE